jgi:hypothetical protein
VETIDPMQFTGTVFDPSWNSCGCVPRTITPTARTIEIIWTHKDICYASPQLRHQIKDEMSNMSVFKGDVSLSENYWPLLCDGVAWSHWPVMFLYAPEINQPQRFAW